MRSLFLASAAALLFAAPASAGNVPAEGSADLAFNTNLPGRTDTAFTEPTYGGEAQHPVDRKTVLNLRHLAIEEFGQSSSKAAADSGDQGPPPGTQSYADSFFSRVENRGVDVPGDA